MLIIMLLFEVKNLFIDCMLHKRVRVQFEIVIVGVKKPILNMNRPEDSAPVVASSVSYPYFDLSHIFSLLN